MYWNIFLDHIHCKHYFIDIKKWTARKCSETPYKGIVLYSVTSAQWFPLSFALRCIYLQYYWNDDGNNYYKSINFNLLLIERTAHNYMLLRTKELQRVGITHHSSHSHKLHLQRHWVDWGCVKFKNVVCMKLDILHCIRLSTYFLDWLTDWYR